MKLERWEKLSTCEQLLSIKAELMRAKTWQQKDREKFLSALERALGLIDLTISDKKWQDNFLMPLKLREEVAKFYVNERSDDISVLYNAL